MPTRFGCWGWIDLWRIGDAPLFTRDEREILAAIATPVAEALRRRQARTFAHTVLPLTRSGPAVLVLSPELEVAVRTPETDGYLRTLLPPGNDGPAIPAAVYNVAAQLIAVESGIDDHAPSARAHLADGIWMTLRAARVEGEGPLEGRGIAVTLEPSSPTERRTLFCASHGLTSRESALVELLARGADTKSLARELFLSEHTVQDHLKSIFAKTGVRDRRTLLSHVTGT